MRKRKDDALVRGMGGYVKVEGFNLIVIIQDFPKNLIVLS